MNREIVLGVWLWIGPFQLGDNEVQNWKKKGPMEKKRGKTRTALSQQAFQTNPLEYWPVGRLCKFNLL